MHITINHAGNSTIKRRRIIMAKNISEVMDTTVETFEAALDSLKELRSLLNGDMMLAKNVGAIDAAARSVVINAKNLAVIDGKVLKDIASAAVTSEYSGRGFLRFVMRMMFNMLEYEKPYAPYDTEKDFYGHKVNTKGYDAALRARMDYRDQFMYLIGKTQAGLSHGPLHIMALKEKENDPTLKYFEMAWGREALCRILKQYKEDVKKFIPVKAKRRCKHPQNYNVGSVTVPVRDFEGYVNGKVDTIIKLIRTAKDYEQVRNILRDFMKKDYIPVNGENLLNKKFVDSYKLFGAYWTMQNLICYHGCSIFVGEKKEQKLSRQESMEMLNKQIETMEGYQALAMLKELINKNKYDFHNDEYIRKYYEAKKTA